MTNDPSFSSERQDRAEAYHCREGRQGELVDRIDLPETVDICRTHRRDYFHSYQFTIPTKLTISPG